MTTLSAHDKVLKFDCIHFDPEAIIEYTPYWQARVPFCLLRPEAGCCHRCKHFCYVDTDDDE